MTSSNSQIPEDRAMFSSLQLGGWLVWCVLVLGILGLSYAVLIWQLVAVDQTVYVGKLLRRLSPVVLALLSGCVAALQLYSKPRGRAGWLALLIFIAAAAAGARAPNFAFESYVLAGGLMMIGAFWLAGRWSALRSALQTIAVGLAAGTVLLAIVEAFLVVSFYRGLILSNAAVPLQMASPEAARDRPLDFPDLFIDVYQSDLPGALRPNLDATMFVEDGELGRVRTNAAGFRSPVQSVLPKPADEFRVLLLGDSFSIGFRSDDSVFIGRQIERHLQAALDQRNPAGPARRVRVYAGWTYQQDLLVRWLKTHGSSRFLEADLILHGICLGNDLAANHFRADLAAAAAERLPTRFLDESRYDRDPSLDANARFKLLRSHLQLKLLLRRRLVATPIWDGLPGRQFGSVPIWNAQNNIGLFLKDERLGAPLFQTFRDYLRQAHAILQRTPGAPPMHLLVYPQRFQQSDREWSAQVGFYGLKSEAFDRELANRKIAAMCTAENWHCLDLLPAFQAQGNRLLYLPFDMHWNGAGNELAGQTVAEYLLKEEVFGPDRESP